MPKIYGVHDGPDRGNQAGSGLDISFEELDTVFARYGPLWLGPDPPVFGVQPSEWPTHVVVEVTAEDGLGPGYARAGFYEIPTISPDRADDLLSVHRATRKDKT